MRQTTLHCSCLAGTVAISPVINGAVESRSVKVHGEDVEDSSNKEEEASDQWERIQEMAHHLGGEQDLKNTQSD